MVAEYWNSVLRWNGLGDWGMIWWRYQKWTTKKLIIGEFTPFVPTDLKKWEKVVIKRMKDKTHELET